MGGVFFSQHPLLHICRNPYKIMVKMGHIITHKLHHNHIWLIMAPKGSKPAQINS